VSDVRLLVKFPEGVRTLKWSEWNERLDSRRCTASKVRLSGPSYIAGLILVRRLVRLAATVRFPRIGTVRIYLLVSRTSATGRVELADPGWAQAQAIGPNDARTRSPRFYPRRYQPQAVTVEPLTSTDGASSDRELALSVVDSGVTHVGWTFAAADGSSKKITIHARVTNNVAFALVKRPLGRLVHAAWSGPNFYPHHRERG
jgi:hypothetical protein